MHRKVRLAVQVAVIALGVWGLVGCFYWPVKDKVAGEPALPEDRIGKAGSGKELQIGVSGRGDVLRVMGDTVRWSPDGRYGIRTYYVTTGYRVWPLCAYADPDREIRYLQLRLGPEGTLEGFDVFDDWQWAVKDTGINGREYQRRAVTRPTTSPAGGR